MTKEINTTIENNLHKTDSVSAYDRGVSLCHMREAGHTVDEEHITHQKTYTIGNMLSIRSFQGCAIIPPMIISSIYYPWQLITFLELLRITLDLHTDLEYNNVAKNIWISHGSQSV